MAREPDVYAEKAWSVYEQEPAKPNVMHEWLRKQPIGEVAAWYAEVQWLRDDSDHDSPYWEAQRIFVKTSDNVISEFVVKLIMSPLFVAEEVE